MFGNLFTFTTNWHVPCDHMIAIYNLLCWLPQKVTGIISRKVASWRDVGFEVHSPVHWGISPLFLWEGKDSRLEKQTSNRAKTLLKASFLSLLECWCSLALCLQTPVFWKSRYTGLHKNFLFYLWRGGEITSEDHGSETSKMMAFTSIFVRYEVLPWSHQGISPPEGK